MNGEPAELGRRVDVEHDHVEVDGVPISVRPGLVYYLLNKPAGVVTTADDPQGRPTVLGLVPDEPRVFPVGRLDLDTEGLVAADERRRSHASLDTPELRRRKEYLAHVEGEPGANDVRSSATACNSTTA